MTDENAAGYEFSIYKCHKEVHAAKLERIQPMDNAAVTLHFIDPRFKPMYVPLPEAERFKHYGYDHPDADRGYMVNYEDGYISWSPTKAFEEGYTRLGTYSTDELPILGDGSSNPDYDIPDRHD